MAMITILTPAELAVRDHPRLAPLFAALEAVMTSGELDTDSTAGWAVLHAYHQLKPSVPVPPPITDACELCGRSWAVHLRCSRCTIGLGEGHSEGPGVKLLDGQTYCGDCAAKILRRPRAAT